MKKNISAPIYVIDRKLTVKYTKNTQTRFVGITYHTHYTSLRLLFLITIISYTSDSVKYRYPWVYGIDFPFLHVPHIYYNNNMCVHGYSKSKRRDV